MQTNLDFLTLHTCDLDAARTFFTDVLGFEANDAPGEIRPTGLSFRRRDGAGVAIRQVPELAAEPGRGLSIYFRVPDAAAYHAEVVSRGATIVGELKEGPDGPVFSVTTLDGHTLGFYQPKG